MVRMAIQFMGALLMLICSICLAFCIYYWGMPEAKSWVDTVIYAVLAIIGFVLWLGPDYYWWDDDGRFWYMQ